MEGDTVRRRVRGSHFAVSDRLSGVQYGALVASRQSGNSGATGHAPPHRALQAAHHVDSQNAHAGRGSHEAITDRIQIDAFLVLAAVVPRKSSNFLTVQSVLTKVSVSADGVTPSPARAFRQRW